MLALDGHAAHCWATGAHALVAPSSLHCWNQLSIGNNGMLHGREETTEREYCCKIRVKEISTGCAQASLDMIFSRVVQYPSIILSEEWQFFVTFIVNQKTLEAIDTFKELEVEFSLFWLWEMISVPFRFSSLDLFLLEVLRFEEEEER